MLASFLITFREGLEAFLIVGIILSYLGKLQATKYNKFIYLGVFIGVVISIIIAYVFQVIIYGMDNETYQHYLMIFILLFATLVLSYMVVWMANQSKQIKGEIEENIKKLVTAGNIAGMVFLAFLAVLREGFETVLFFSSLSFSESITFEDGLIGALSGLVLSIILVYFLMKGAKNIPIKSNDYSETEIVDSIGSAHMALELMQSRFADGAGQSFYENLADCMFNQGVYVGPELDKNTAINTSKVKITVAQGAKVREFEGEHPNKRAIDGLIWLVNYMNARGVELKAGAVIITGSFKGIVDMTFDIETTISYEGLGEYQVNFIRKI